MGWKEKIEYREFVLFCDIYRSRTEIEERFGLTKSESIHALKYFSKFDDDFLVEKDVGVTGKAWWIKSRPEALEYWRNREQ